MAYKISLDTDVSCYRLLDSGKIFVNKEISTYIDFTDKTVLQGVDVEEKFNAQELDEKAVVLPVFSRIERIGDTALCGRNLQHVKFPGLLSIDAYGLRENDLLENIELDQVKRIGQGGFLDCKNLHTVRIGSNIEEIAADAFRKSDPQDPQSIQDLTIDRLSTEVRGAETGFGLDDKTVIHFKEPGSYPVPPTPEVTAFLSVVAGVNKVELNDYGQAYWNQAISNVIDFTDLTAIRYEDVEYRVSDLRNKFIPIFGENLSAIHQNAFTTCKMHNFKFSNTLTSIGDVSFGECSGLPYAKLKNIKTIDYGAFQGSDIPGVEFGQNIERISELAFNDCNKLSTVIFTNDIKNIGENAFPAQASAYFTQYKQVLKTYDNYPWGLIEDNIFAPKLTGVTSSLILTAENLTKEIVERNAIENYTVASLLTSLIIQSSCQTIASDAFSTCTNVTSAFFAERNMNQVKSMGQIPFGLANISYIYPEKEVIEDLSVLTLHSTVVDATAVNNALLEQGLTKDQVLSLQFNYQCLSVQNNAFNGFDSVTDVIFESINIIDIENSVFANCQNLSNINFQDGYEYIVRSMPGYPFGKLSSNITTKYYTPRTTMLWLDTENITEDYLDSLLFKNCLERSGVSGIFVAPTCKSIGSHVFHDLSARYVNLSRSLTSIAPDAFEKETFYVKEDFTTYFTEDEFTKLPGYPFGLDPNKQTFLWFVEKILDLTNYSRITNSIFKNECQAQGINPISDVYGVKFSNSLKEIGPECFLLKNPENHIGYDINNILLELPPSLTSIGESALVGISYTPCLYCNAISVESISGSNLVFKDIEELRSIYLPRMTKLVGTFIDDCNTLNDFNAPKLEQLSSNSKNPVINNAKLSYINLDNLTSFTENAISNIKTLFSRYDFPNLKSISKLSSASTGFTPLRIPNVLSVNDAALSGKIFTSTSKKCELPLATYIGANAFTDAKFLESVKIPNAKKISEYAINDCQQLLDIYLPEAVEIAYGSLQNNPKLEKIYLPKVKTIGGVAFQNNFALLSLDLPEAENIGTNAFSRCISLEKVRVKNNKTISMLRKQSNYPWGIDDESKFVVQYDTPYNIVLSNEVIDKAFVDNWTYEWNSDIPSISGLTIELGCKRIESGAFENFIGLNNVTIPSTVEFIGKSAFYGCNNLTLKFDNRTWEQIASMPGYPFGLPTSQLRATTSKPKVDSSLRLATDVVCCKVSEDGKIFVNASECAILDGTVEIVTKSIIDKQLQDIALNRNTSFQIIACLSSSTTQICDEAFAGLSNLYYVDFVDDHNNLTSIEKASFKDCNVISSIVFEAWNMHDVAICSAYPFGLFNDMCLSATDMADVTVIDHDVGDWSIPGLSDCSFALIRKGCQYVQGSSDRSDYCFANNPNLSTVICKHQCQIQSHAFYNCSAITEIDFPEVEYIGSYAFYNNGYNYYFYTTDSWPVLSSVKLPKCKQIGIYAFRSNPNIEELDLPEVKFIEQGAFENELEYTTSQSNRVYGKSSKLRKVNAPKCKQLYDYTFRNCANLTSINMPELQGLGERVFALDFQFGDSSYTYKDKPILREINLPKVEYLAPYTFYGQSALVDIDVPSLTSIAEKALGHTGLTSFNAGNLSLYPYALADMDIVSADLENATFEERNGYSAGHGMFQDNKNLSAVKMDNMTMFTDYMFIGCNKLSSVSFNKNKITSHGSNVFGYDDSTNYDAPYANTIKYLDFPNLTGSNYGHKFLCYRNLISANLPRMTSIREYDFQNLPNLVSVYMPNCTLIETRAFYESGIQEFYVPRSVTSIARDDYYNTPFYSCHKLADLSVDSRNSTYFSDKDGTHYPAIFKWIDSNDKSQGYQLWVATNRLSSLPDGLTKISEGDLEYMKSLTSIYIPATLTSDLYHLHGLSALQAISVAQGNPRYTDMGGCNVVAENVDYPYSQLKYIRYTISNIADGNEFAISRLEFNAGNLTDPFNYSSAVSAFDSDGNEYSYSGNNNALKALDHNNSTEFKYTPQKLPYTVTYDLADKQLDLFKYKQFAWYHYYGSYTSIPKSIKIEVSENNIDWFELTTTSPRYEWDYPYLQGYIDNLQSKLQSQQIKHSYKKHLIVGCGSSRLCGDIVVIESGAFAERNALTSLVCEEPTLSALKEIQSGAFDSCANLKELKIACPTEGAAQIKVGYQAIKYNGAMLSLELANISSFATTSDRYHEPLAGCDRLEHIELDGISAIPEYLCQARANLKSAKFDGIVEIKTNSFNNCYELSSASFGSQLTAIRSGAFDGCNKLTGINDVDYSNIKVVESAAFRRTKLQKAEFSQLTSIADYTFAGTQISSINMPLLKNIGSGALSGCKFIDIDLPGVQSIGSGAFAENKLLSAVNLPDLTSIGTGYYGAFGFCDKLLSIELPHLKSFAGLQYNSMLCIVAPEATSIANYAFRNCSNLICVDVSQATSVGDYAFERCIALSSIVLPKASYIGSGVFEDCSCASEIKIPAVSGLHYYDFRGCSALTSLQFEKLKEVDSGIFSYTALREITLPSTLTYLHMNAFNHGYIEQDEQKETYRVYYYKTLCPDLSMVWFKGRSYDKVISEIDREDHDYNDEKPYIYAKGVPYWGIDRKYIKLDNKYTSILKLATGTKRYDTGDGGIVYSKTPILDLTAEPKSRQVSYLQSSGSQWIDTEIIPDNSIRFESKIRVMTNNFNWQVFFGTTRSDSSNDGILYRCSNKVNTYNAWYCNAKYDEATIYKYYYYDDHTISLENSKMMFDNKQANITTSGIPYNGSIYLFCGNNGGTPWRHSSIRMYYFKIYKGNMLIRDLIPIIDKNEVPCFYDRVSNKNFYNKGTGQFSYE